MVTKNQPAHNRMAKLFQTEKQKMAESDKAEILQKSNTTARKQSLLPIKFDEDKDDDEENFLLRLMLMMTTMTMMKIMRTNKSIVFSSILRNICLNTSIKINCCNTR